ncbi:MAG: YidC/Oxa1 family membrane protein insertase [Oscillospiraceae bacterium]
MYFIESFIHNYGFTLILFVILARLIQFPLSISQQKLTAKQAYLQPKQKALEKKCGKDKQKYQEELMKLYEEEGVNPMGGCLPMLVNFAFLFGIVDVIYKPLKHLVRVPEEMIKGAMGVLTTPTSSELTLIQAIKDAPDKFATIFTGDWLEKIVNFDMTFLGINLGTTPVFGFNLLMLIPVISGLTSLLISFQSLEQQKRQGQNPQGAMKFMLFFSPVISIWFGFSLPVGVSIYWIVSNILMWVQQIVLAKIYSPEKVGKMNDKNSDKVREKMRKKREKMEEYNKKMQEQGLAPKALPKETVEKQDSANDKELAKVRLAEARKRMAEKYGDDYNQ